MIATTNSHACSTSTYLARKRFVRKAGDGGGGGGAGSGSRRRYFALRLSYLSSPSRSAHACTIGHSDSTEHHYRVPGSGLEVWQRKLLYVLMQVLDRVGTGSGISTSLEIPTM